MAESLNIIGVMSGTSMDGLDLVCCQFTSVSDDISYQVLAKQEVSFTERLLSGLKNCREMSGLELSYLDVELGKFIGQNIREFIDKRSLHVDYIASHGHTVFHDPKQSLTKQIGSGAEIVIQSGVNTIVDFRTTDLALGGQGAPLVPVGDWQLFSKYDACLNLGGIANVSMKRSELAFDISPCNLLLNRLVAVFGLDFDKNGEKGRQGTKNQELFEVLNEVPYYSMTGPKSLGAEYLEEHFYQLLDDCHVSPIDQLATIYHHIAYQVSKFLNSSNVLITGGGAKNQYLIELFESYSGFRFTKAQDDLIDFKEAIIFAYLGYLRVNGETNINSKVTGSSKSNIGGAIYLSS